MLTLLYSLFLLATVASPPAALSQGAIRGEVTVPLPSGVKWSHLGGVVTVRATVPVPRGTYRAGPGLSTHLELVPTSPLVDAMQATTQVEVVSTYARDEVGVVPVVDGAAFASDDADIVELIRTFEVDAALNTQDLTFTVNEVGTPPVYTGDTAGATTMDLLDPIVGATGGFAAQPELASLLVDPAALVVVTTDWRGHRYACFPLADKGLGLPAKFQIENSIRRKGQGLGSQASTIRAYGLQKRITPLPAKGPTSERPPAYLFGVHAYLTTMRGSGALSLDLRVSNGRGRNHAHCSANTTTFGPSTRLGQVRFKDIELYVAQSPSAAWAAHQRFEDPCSNLYGTPGTAVVDDLGLGARAYCRYSLVSQPNSCVPAIPAANSGPAKYHVMPDRAQFQRRILVTQADPSHPDHEEATLLGAGQGFCVDGVLPTTSGRTWSWWNSRTARYGFQKMPQARLDHLLPAQTAAARTRLTVLSSQMASALATGTPFPSGLIGVESNTQPMGWARPWGSIDDQPPGGNFVSYTEGAQVAWLGSLSGMNWLRLRHRLQMERAPLSLVDDEGDAVDEEFLLNNGVYDLPYYWLPSPTAMTNQCGYCTILDMPYFAEAPLADRAFYDGQINQRWKTTNIFSWIPYNISHSVRHFAPALALAQLENDPLAKDDILSWGGLYRLIHTEHALSGGGGTSSSLVVLKDQTTDPGKLPLFVGRSEGWGLAMSSSALGLAPDPRYTYDTSEAPVSNADWVRADLRSRWAPWTAEVQELYRLGRVVQNVEDKTPYAKWAFLSSLAPGFSHGQSYFNWQMMKPFAHRQPFEESILIHGLTGLLQSAQLVPTARAELREDIALSARGLITPLAWTTTPGQASTMSKLHPVRDDGVLPIPPFRNDRTIPGQPGVIDWWNRLDPGNPSAQSFPSTPLYDAKPVTVGDLYQYGMLALAYRNELEVMPPLFPEPRPFLQRGVLATSTHNGSYSDAGWDAILSTPAPVNQSLATAIRNSLYSIHPDPIPFGTSANEYSVWNNSSLLLGVLQDL